MPGVPPLPLREQEQTLNTASAPPAGAPEPSALSGPRGPRQRWDKRVQLSVSTSMLSSTHALPGPLSSVTSSSSPGFRRAGVLRLSHLCPRTISTHLHCLCHPCPHQDCASHPPRLSAEPGRGGKEFKQSHFDGMFKKEIEGKMYLLQ